MGWKGMEKDENEGVEGAGEIRKGRRGEMDG